MRASLLISATSVACLAALHADLPPPFPTDPAAKEERTCFQTSLGWNEKGNLRSDVALVYGIDPGLPDRIKSWHDRGYIVHTMTGVAWGQYQDYLYGRFDGVDHQDNVQTDKNGKKIGHGGDVWYMCPAANYGDFLCVGVQRALDAGAEAIHLEEPEFWARAGYSEGFKREWKDFYKEDWQPPHLSVDGQWKSSKLKYYLYRRALQQVFAYVHNFNAKTGKKVRCYVATHSLLNYAHWCIVSPQSSLAKIEGCDGYIAQVWTGTSRTPNHFRGQLKERTFETAFLEYGAMQNLVRATGRSVWYLNDPVEDNPQHDWTDYKTNWESTLTASLLQPDVASYEVAPWPERIFGGKYPKNAKPEDRIGIPPEYATELQVVMNALNDMKQPDFQWDAGTQGVGVLVSDSMMFQREQPTPSDPHMAQLYGQMLPLVKRGLPVAPVQLENVTLPGFLDNQKVLMLSYQGQKPMNDEVHAPIAEWVKKGGVLVVVDDDSDPFNKVKEWWNDGGKNETIPRQHLFSTLGVKDEDFAAGDQPTKEVGKGAVVWLKINPVKVALNADQDDFFASVIQKAVERTGGVWKQTNYLALRRGPYWIGAGMDETFGSEVKTISGRLVNLFDAELKVQSKVELKPGSRYFLLDLDRLKGEGTRVLASGCKALKKDGTEVSTWTVEGVGGTNAIVLMACDKAPKVVKLAGQALEAFEYDAAEKLLRVKFPNEATPRELTVE
jgi:hypothetical protein